MMDEIENMMNENKEKINKKIDECKYERNSKYFITKSQRKS